MNRMTDDDAPITTADVEAARALLGRLRLLRPFAVVAGLVGVACAASVTSRWHEQRSTRVACEARVAERHAAIEQAWPADAVLHHGPGGTVVDTPELAALVIDGRVVASSLRCGPGERWPARAWVSRSY